MHNTCSTHITTLGRLIALCVLAVTSVLTAGSTTSIASLYEAFNDSRGNRQVLVANELMQALKVQDYIDTLYRFSNSETTLMNSQVHYHMSEYYYLTSNYEQALEAGKRACEASRHLRDAFYSSDLNNLLGITHVRLGNYADALTYFEKAYKIDLELRDEERLSSDMNSQASVYLSAKLPAQGIACINEAIAIERKLQHDDCLAIRLGMASELYLLDNQPQAALIYAKEAYELDHNAGRRVKAAIRQSQLAAAMMALDSLAPAMKNLENAVAVLKEAGEKNSLSICYSQLGKLALKTGKLDAAENYFTLTLELCSETGNRSIERQAEYGLWQLLRAKNPALALKHLERYNVLTDSLLAYDTMAQLNSFRIKFRTDELQRQNHNYSKRVKVLAWTCAALVILMLISFQFVFHYRKKLRQQPMPGNEHLKIQDNFPTNVDEESVASSDQLVPVVDAIYAQMASGQCGEASISTHMGISVRKLRDIIAENTGEKPAAFIMNVRLAYAKRLLKNSEQPVSEISQRCGFHSIAHFSKAFKAVCGVSPTQYRRMSTIEPNDDNQSNNL